MKAIILLLTAALGSYVTVLNVQHSPSLRKQAAAEKPEAIPVVANNDNDNVNTDPVDDAAPTADPLMSVSDLTRTQGEPVRKERSTNGTTVYYYPYYVYYVRNYAVVHSRRIATAPVPNNSSSSTSGGRLWGNNSFNVTTTSSRGTAVPATTNPGWQGGGGAAAVSAPRTVVVHQSAPSVQHRSTGATFTGGSSQWQH